MRWPRDKAKALARGIPTVRERPKPGVLVRQMSALAAHRFDARAERLHVHEPTRPRPIAESCEFLLSTCRSRLVQAEKLALVRLVELINERSTKSGGRWYMG